MPEPKNSYNDYPEAAKKNAKRAIEYREEYKPDCGTRVGWLRANQLANGENISYDTIKRCYNFLNRFERYAGNDISEGCGKLMYLAWGGKAMLPYCRKIMRIHGDLKD